MIDRPKERKPSARPLAAHGEAIDASLIRTSAEGETKVSVEKPEVDVWAKKWLDANEAYYRERDLEQATSLAKEIVAGAGARPEVGLARELLCEAFIAMQKPDEALAACTDLLEISEGESARALNYKIATIYRTQRNDCKRAIAHYTQAIVFGRATFLDDEAMIWRAHCEIEVGDIAAARWDVSVLETRTSLLNRADEIADLRRRLPAR